MPSRRRRSGSGGRPRRSAAGAFCTELASASSPSGRRSAPPPGQGVEGGDEGVPRVGLALAPAVAGDLEGAAVAQDGLRGERRLAQQVPDDLGRELRLDEVENPTSFGAGGHRKVAGVEGSGCPPPPWTRSRFGCGAWTGCPESHRRPAVPRGAGSSRRGA